MTFVADYNINDQCWHVVNTSTGRILESYDSKQEAEDEVDAVNNCKHIHLESPTWSYDQDDTVRILCRDCGQVANVSIVPSQLKWG